MENCQRNTRKVKSTKKRQKKNEEPRSNADLPEISEVETSAVIDKPINKRKRKDCSSQKKQSTSASGPKYVPKFKKKKTTNTSKDSQDKDKNGKKVKGYVKDKINILETVPLDTNKLAALQEKKEKGGNEFVNETVQVGMKAETENKEEKLILNKVKEITIDNVVSESTDRDQNETNIEMKENQGVTESTDEKTAVTAGKPVDVEEVNKHGVDRFEQPGLISNISDTEDGIIVQINNETINNSECKPLNEMKVDNIVSPELMLNNKKLHDLQLSNETADTELLKEEEIKEMRDKQEILVNEIKTTFIKDNIADTEVLKVDELMEVRDKPEILVNEMKTTFIKDNTSDKLEQIRNKHSEMETNNIGVEESVNNEILEKVISEIERGSPDKVGSPDQVRSVTVETDHSVELVVSISNDTPTVTKSTNIIKDLPKYIEINNEVTDGKCTACQPIMDDDQMKQILKQEKEVEEILSGLISDVVMCSHSVTQNLINKKGVAEDTGISNLTPEALEHHDTVEQVTNVSSCIESTGISIVTEDIPTVFPDINAIGTTSGRVIENEKINMCFTGSTDVTEAAEHVVCVLDTNDTLNCTEKESESENQTINPESAEMLQVDIAHDPVLNTSKTMHIPEKESNGSIDHSEFNTRDQHITATVTEENMINKHSSIGATTYVVNDLVPGAEDNSAQNYDIPEVNKEQIIDSVSDKANDQIISTPPVCNRTDTTENQFSTKTCDVQVVVTGIPQKTSDGKMINSSTDTCAHSIGVDGDPQLLKVKHGKQESHVPCKIRNNQTYNEFEESATTIKPEEINKTDVDIHPKETTGNTANSCVLEMLPEYHSSDLQELDEDNMLDITDSQMCQVELEYSTLDNTNKDTKSNRMKETDEKFHQMLQEKKNEGSRQIMGIIRDLHQFNNWLTTVSQQISQSKRTKHHRYNMNK